MMKAVHSIREMMKNHIQANERYQTRGSVEGSVLSGITTITGMGLRDESYDLCDECIGELLDWLRNEQNDEGAEK